MFDFQHLNSPRHNINYADSMAKAKADSAPGSALGGHHGSMHAGVSIGENLNSYSIPMLNMFLQTLQPPAQNCRYIKIANKKEVGRTRAAKTFGSMVAGVCFLAKIQSNFASIVSKCPET